MSDRWRHPGSTEPQPFGPSLPAVSAVGVGASSVNAAAAGLHPPPPPVTPGREPPSMEPRDGTDESSSGHDDDRPAGAPDKEVHDATRLDGDGGGGGSSGEDLAVRVAVRARPLIAKERLERARECLAYPVGGKSVMLGKNRLFQFDEVFDPAAEQRVVYADLVAPLVASCFAGYNATVFAYGQTGSGKTYTMGSGNSTALLEDEVGIIPRVISDIFAGIEKRKGQSEISVRCAFLEVHNEEVRDLLHPDTSTKSITIRERADGTIVVSGIKEVTTKSYDDMLRLLENGSVSRTTGATKMNAGSSRSHAIFTVILEQRHLTREQIRAHSGAYTSAKFHLVDLAGSERNKRTGAAGMRFKESININSGLLALGNVISALSDEQDRKQKPGQEQKHSHVPYRESKLTRLLQDSLGGNSRTCMIACVSAADQNLEETLNTLKYAARARNIRNKPVVNRDPAAAQLAAIREGGGGLGGLHGAGIVIAGLDEAGVASLREAAESAEADVASARAELARVTAAVEVAEEEAMAARAERDHALIRVEQLEYDMASALVVAGELSEAGELTEAGFARLAAVAPKGARETAAGRGAPLPSLSPADRAAAAVSLAHSAVSAHTRVQASFGGEGTPHAGAAEPMEPCRVGVNARDSLEMGGGGGKGVIEGYLRELRSLKETLSKRDEELAAKEAKLTEAKEDLMRDEAIFAEKMKEIKSLRLAAREAAAAMEEQERRHQGQMASLMAAHAAATEALSNRSMLPAGEDQPAAGVVSSGIGSPLPPPLPPPPPVLPKTPGSAALLGRSGAFSPASGDEAATLAWAVPRGAGQPSSVGASVLPATPRHPPSAMSSATSALALDDDDVVVMGAVGGGDGGGDTPSGSRRRRGGAGRDGEASEIRVSMEALDVEKERLLAEKSQIEREKAKVEEEAVSQARRYQAEKKLLERQLRELECNISSKEELIADLERNEQEARSLTQRYEERMKAMEQDKAGKESEIERLRVELEEIDSNVAKGAEEKRKMREQYEEKVRRVQGQLRKLQLQRFESNNLRTEKERQKHEAKVRDLEAEVSRMRSMQETLKRKLREREDRHVVQQEEQSREINTLKKTQETQNRRIKELEGDKERQRAALRRKTDELAAAQRKLQLLGAVDASLETGVSNGGADADQRASTASNTGNVQVSIAASGLGPRPTSGAGGSQSARPMSSRERAHAYGEQVKARGPGMGPRSGGEGGGLTARRPHSARDVARGTKHAAGASSERAVVGLVAPDIKAISSLIDSEAARALKQREGEEEAKRIEAKRVAVLEEKELAIRERDTLELRRERASAQLTAERDELAAVLDGLDDALAGLESAGASAGSDAAERAESLRERRVAAALRLTSVEQRLNAGRVLHPEEERALRELEDRVDGLEAEAEYVTAALTEARRDAMDDPRASGAAGGGGGLGGGKKAGGEGGFREKISGMSSSETRAALTVCLDKVVSLQLHERDGQARVCELEMQLSDAQSAIEEMESGLRMKEMEFDRRVTELQREHSRKEAYLLKLSNLSAEEIQRRGAQEAQEQHRRQHQSSAQAADHPSEVLQSQLEFREKQVAVLSKESHDAKAANKDLKRRIRALLAEREEMEEAAMKMEEQLESRARDAQLLEAHVARLSTARRASRSEAMNESAAPHESTSLRAPGPSDDLDGELDVPSMASPPPAKTSGRISVGSSRGGHLTGGHVGGELPATPNATVRVSRSAVRALTPAEVEAARRSATRGPPSRPRGRPVGDGALGSPEKAAPSSPIASYSGLGFSSY